MIRNRFESGTIWILRELDFPIADFINGSLWILDW